MTASRPASSTGVKGKHQQFYIGSSALLWLLSGFHSTPYAGETQLSDILRHFQALQT